MPKSSSSTVWAVGLLSALILYLLSPGALMLCTQAHIPLPSWCATLVSPITWACDKFPPLADLYAAYFSLLGIRKMVFFF
jgi:hypothetical protein